MFKTSYFIVEILEISEEKNIKFSQSIPLVKH